MKKIDEMKTYLIFVNHEEGGLVEKTDELIIIIWWM